MTNKQYEHLGRAVFIEARLETMREAMDGDVRKLSDALRSLIGGDAARAWVGTHYGKNMSTLFGVKDFMDMVREITTKEGEEKKQ